MKKYTNKFNEEEIEILSSQLDPREMYILGFLKGFDRKTLKEWNEKGLMDFSVKIR